MCVNYALYKIVEFFDAFLLNMNDDWRSIYHSANKNTKLLLNYLDQKVSYNTKIITI